MVLMEMKLMEMKLKTDLRVDMNLYLQAELSYIPFKLPQMTLIVLSLSLLYP